jgi:hypothetical protein
LLAGLNRPVPLCYAATLRYLEVDMPLFWLSFCDPAKPEGSQFLGASIVETCHYTLATREAWAQNCNPGGEVRITEISDDALNSDPAIATKLKTHMNRLMTKADLAEIGLL